jgi:cbb3-type cytochrome oxidase maturation protein
MSILFVLIPLSLVLTAGAIWAFWWAVDNGQFDDLAEQGSIVIEAEESPAPETTQSPSPTSSQHPLT